MLKNKKIESLKINGSVSPNALQAQVRKRYLEIDNTERNLVA